MSMYLHSLVVMIHAWLRSILSPVEAVPYPAYRQGPVVVSMALSSALLVLVGRMGYDLVTQETRARGSESVSKGLRELPGREVRVRIWSSHRSSQGVGESYRYQDVKGKTLLRCISQSLDMILILCYNAFFQKRTKRTFRICP